MKVGPQAGPPVPAVLKKPLEAGRFIPPPRPRREKESEDPGGTHVGHGGPLGGPLGTHAAPAEIREPGRVEPLAAEQVADRIVAGVTREGLPEVRLGLSVGAFRGTEVRLLAGYHGLEASFVVPTEAARRVVEGHLAQLARALERRGIRVAACDVALRGRSNRSPTSG